jgi:hypothetical protein
VIGEFGRIFAKSGRIPAEFHRYLMEASEERLGGDYEAVYVGKEQSGAVHPGDGGVSRHTSGSVGHNVGFRFP